MEERQMLFGFRARHDHRISRRCHPISAQSQKASILEWKNQNLDKAGTHAYIQACWSCLWEPNFLNLVHLVQDWMLQYMHCFATSSFAANIGRCAETFVSEFCVGILRFTSNLVWPTIKNQIHVIAVQFMSSPASPQEYWKPPCTCCDACFYRQCWRLRQATLL